MIIKLSKTTFKLSECSRRQVLNKTYPLNYTRRGYFFIANSKQYLHKFQRKFHSISKIIKKSFKFSSLSIFPQIKKANSQPIRKRNFYKIIHPMPKLVPVKINSINCCFPINQNAYFFLNKNKQGLTPKRRKQKKVRRNNAKIA